MSLVIKNCRTLELDEPIDILIDDEKIVSVGKNISGDEVIDGTNKICLPGFIDPQVHFREPGFEYKEDLESGAKAALKGGFTSVVCMPNTKPAVDNVETLNYIQKRQKELSLIDIHQSVCVTKGLKGRELTDFEKLKSAGAIAFTDDGHGIQDDELMFKAMEQLAKLNMPLLDHSENEKFSAGGAISSGQRGEDFNISLIEPKAEWDHVERGCDYAFKTGCRFHVLHISTKESIQAVRVAKEKGAPVTCEVSPHHLLLNVEEIPFDGVGLNPNFKMNPPLRSLDDIIAINEAFLDGTIDFVATDHAPHTDEEKSVGFEKAPFGIIGLETCFPLLYSKYVKTGILSLNRLVEMMNSKPCELFHLEPNKIKEGYLANLSLWDLHDEYVFYRDFFSSKCQNSPFIGERVFAKNTLTLYRGKVLFQ